VNDGTDLGKFSGGFISKYLSLVREDSSAATRDFVRHFNHDFFSKKNLSLADGEYLRKVLCLPLNA
jgi:hypothetical protein